MGVVNGVRSERDRTPPMDEVNTYRRRRRREGKGKGKDQEFRGLEYGKEEDTRVGVVGRRRSDTRDGLWRGPRCREERTVEEYHSSR